MCLGACSDVYVWDSFACVEVLVTELMMHERDMAFWQVMWLGHLMFSQHTVYVE